MTEIARPRMGEMLDSLAAAWATNAWFTIVAGIASIASLALTVVIERRTSLFSKWLFRRERLPDLHRDLDRLGSQLISLMNDFANNRQDILHALGRIRAVVGNLASKLERHERTDSSELAADIGNLLRRVDGLRPSEQDCHQISARVSELRETLRQLVKDERRRTSP